MNREVLYGLALLYLLLLRRARESVLASPCKLAFSQDFFLRGLLSSKLGVNPSERIVTQHRTVSIYELSA